MIVKVIIDTGHRGPKGNMNADIWIKKTTLICAGCEDERPVKKEMTSASFDEVRAEFAERHANCAHQGKLPGAK